MTLKILESDPFDKGHVLESILKKILQALHYEQVKINKLTKGYELDFKAKNLIGGGTVIGECKAKSKPVDTTDILKFFGKYTIEKEKDEQLVAILISLSGLNRKAEEVYEQIARTLKEKFTIYYSDELLNLLYKTGIIKNDIASFQKKVDSIISDLALISGCCFENDEYYMLYLRENYYWIQTISSPSGKNFIALDNQGKQIKEYSILKNLYEADKDLYDRSIEPLYHLPCISSQEIAKAMLLVNSKGNWEGLSRKILSILLSECQFNIIAEVFKDFMPRHSIEESEEIKLYDYEKQLADEMRSLLFKEEEIMQYGHILTRFYQECGDAYIKHADIQRSSECYEKAAEAALYIGDIRCAQDCVSKIYNSIKAGEKLLERFWNLILQVESIFQIFSKEGNFPSYVLPIDYLTLLKWLSMRIKEICYEIQNNNYIICKTKSWSEKHRHFVPCIPSSELSEDENILIKKKKYYKDKFCHYPCVPEKNKCGDIVHTICPACYFLGANGLNGFVRIPFLYPEKPIIVNDLYSSKIDRFTGTVTKGTNRPYSFLPNDSIFQGTMTVIIQDDILHWEIGKPRNLGERTGGDQWLKDVPSDADQIIQEFIIDRLKKIQIMGGYKSKGCGAVKIEVTEIKN